jgi:hypothetical protein
MVIPMDNNWNSHFGTNGDESQNFFKNIKKLRVGIMLDNYRLEAWDYKMLEAITGTEYASIELVMLNESKDEKKSFREKVLSNWNNLFYIAYTKLEDRIIQPKPAFFSMDAQNLLKDVPVIGIKPIMDKNSDWFQEQDIEKIKESNLDVIVQRGFRILKGNILNAAKYGVWSYHHDDNTAIIGGPAGFWETFERMGEQGVILQILTDNPEQGIVIYRSFFPCYFFSVGRNNNDCFLRSSLFVPRTLKRLYNEGEKIFFDNIARENEKVKFYNYALYKHPNNFEFLKMFIKHSYHISVEYFPLIFFQYQWMLMYDLQDQISTSFWRFKKIIPPRDRFWADPHVFFKDDMYYIFIEEYLYKKKKAHISLIEMHPSGKHSDPVMILEEPFHLSYSHVFEYNGILYMIPETRSAKSINLYQCTGFPTEWKHRATLIDSINAVDSTILFHKNKWWLFTNIAEPEGTSLNNELYLFYADKLLSNNWNNHPMNPVISDVKRARPAGKILERNGILYRPSQCCNPWYGYGIKLNEIVVLTEHDYLEREIAFIEPKWDKKLKGVHTLCHENRLTMIDGHYQKFIV